MNSCCSSTQSIATQQECLVTSQTKVLVDHTPINAYILNISTLHNYQHIEAAIPSFVCDQIHVMIYSILFFSRTCFFFSCDYSSSPCHQPADYTCLCNRFLPSDSMDFSDSALLTHICFFTIPSHSTVFHLTLLYSGTFQVSGI